MAFYFFQTQLQQLAGGTIPGTLTVTGALTTQGGIVNSTTITSTGQISTSGVAAVASAGNLTAGVGSLDIQTAGQGLKVKEGANAKQGQATLVAGTVTVANTSVTASSKIFLTVAVAGGTLGNLSVGTITAATSFVINSSNVADTSTVNYEIFEPG